MNSSDSFTTALSDREKVVLGALLDLVADRGSLETLKAKPPHEILNPEEIAVYKRLRAESHSVVSGMRPHTVMIMKATRLCNLRCTYCQSWREGPNQVMRFAVLVRAIRDSLLAPGTRHVEFVWHGGEVTLLPIAFYLKALWLQQQFRQPGQSVTNSVQTNGTLLTDQWIEFLQHYQFSVGVSLDGPKEVHDRRRLDKNGCPTSELVRQGIEKLKTAGIKYGALMVVDDELMDVGPVQILDYLLEIGIESVGILNAIPKNTPLNDPLSGTFLPWPDFVGFLRALFLVWWPKYKDRIVIRELAALVNSLLGHKPTMCEFAGNCMGQFLTVEPNGDVLACDKYIGDEAYWFGNLFRNNLPELLKLSPNLVAIQAENETAVGRMRDCPWFSICNGGCPHDRRLNERYVPGHNEHCCGLEPLLADIKDALASQ